MKHEKLCRFYLAGFCPNGRAGPPDRDNVISCEYGSHTKWVDEKSLPKPEVKKYKSPEEVQREQEEREDEFYAEEEKRRERFERGEGGVGRGWGRRRRGGGGGGRWSKRGG